MTIGAIPTGFGLVTLRQVFALPRAAKRVSIQVQYVLHSDARIRKVSAGGVIRIRAVNGDAGLVDGFVLVAPEGIIEVGYQVAAAVPIMKDHDLAAVSQPALVVN